MADSEGALKNMPALFVGHGNPMNAVSDTVYARGWRAMVRDVPRPEAVLCVSAHWNTTGVAVNTTPLPVTLHDFRGFPPELYEVSYPCPGSPEWAAEAAGAVNSTRVVLDPDRGLDHGVWAVGRWMYPDADVPVFQMSLDRTRPASFHYELGRQLAPLRLKGILILGSGNMVHNLSMMDMSRGAPPYDWAADFDILLRDLLGRRHDERLIDYGNLGPSARLAVPTPEHFLPLLTILGATTEDEPLEFFNEGIDLRSVSMTSLVIGGINR